MSTVACTTVVRGRVEREVDLTPAAVGVDDQPLAVPDPGAVRSPGQGAGAVATHLRPATVGVAQHHRAIGAVRARIDRDEPVGTDPAVAIAEQRHVRGRDRRDVPLRGEVDEEVVAGGFELGELERALHAHHHARSAGSTAHEFSVAPNQVIRGSRRNHMRWRRDSARVRRIATSRAVARSGSRPWRKARISL